MYNFIKYLIIICFLFNSNIYSQLGTTTSTISTDNHNNGNFTNGSDGGSGFGNWTIATANGSDAGSYTGGSAIGTAFALWSNSSTISASRLFDENLKKGDVFSIVLGHTTTINNEIGIQLINSSGDAVITLKYSNGASEWQLNNGGSDFGSGQGYSANTALTFTFTYDDNNSADKYSYSFGSGSGNAHTASNDISTIRGFKVYSNYQGGSQNFGFNNISIVSKYTIDGNQTVECNDSQDIPYLTIKNGSTLNITKNGKVKVRGDFSNSGTTTLNSDSANYSSLIVQGSSAGNITYKRHVADEGTDEWDFIGSPVIGQDLQNLIDNNSTLATNGSQVAIGVFNNNAGSDNAAAMYTNFNTTGNSGTTITSGQGFAMATDEGSTTATVDFTGTISTTNVSFAIDDASSSNANYGKFNLVANPFPSFINANDDADASNNFLTVNASDLHTSYAAIYAYDGDGTFTAINHTNPGSAVYISPGQGFFVASDDASGDSVSFTEAMQTSSGSDDFISGDNMDVTEVLIKLFNGENELESTKLYFEDGLSDGLDVGYDAGNFHAEASIMTRLVEEDEGYGMAINAMGLDAMENAVIPLVINQSAGQEFRVNLHTATIPDPNVYLEDVEEGTFTNLYEEDFVYTPTSDLEGVGRFFIHMSADTMSNEDVSTSMLNAYKEVNANYITIEGLATQSNNINVSLYNILGRKVLDTTLNNNMNTQTISTLGMAAGIYVIELESGTDRLTKKLIIQ